MKTHVFPLLNLLVVVAMLVTALPAAATSSTTGLAARSVAAVSPPSAVLVHEPQSPRAATSADAGPFLRLRSGAFDPEAGEPAPPLALRRTLIAGQPGLRLVQFPGPIHDEWYQALTKAGLQVVTYMPDYAYLVWGDEVGVKSLQADTPVRWAGAYQPFYALHPDLVDPGKLAAEVEVIVQVYDHAGADETVQAVLGQAKQVLRAPQQVLTYRNLGVRIGSDKLTWLASLSDVVNVEPRPQYKKLDEVQGQIMAGNLNAAGTQPTGPGYLTWLTNHGFPTTAVSYPIVDVTDDGIDNGTSTPLHPDFYTLGLTNTLDRLIYNVNWTTDAAADGLDGHGNLNASIVAAYNDKTGSPYEDGNGFNYGLGISPYGRVAGSKVFCNGGTWCLPGDNYTALISNTYALGARISTNSWGANTGGAYTSDDQAYDALVRDAQPGAGVYAGNQEIAIVFSAGNAGSGSNTTGSPGNAKNVVTVGAAENYRPTWTDGCGVGPTGADNAQDIISFSSRGPTDDQRVKPDIVAPGTHIEGAASQDPGYNGSGVCDQYMPAGQTLYAASSGTSHSAPAIAGAASLVNYYYQNRFGAPPSPAMTKAYLINATRYLTGTGASGNLPSNNQGYGEIYLEQAFNNANRMVVDESRLLTDSGQVYEIQGTVPDAAQPFRVTLAWTDAPGPTTGNAYVNNLDLEVIVNGQTYRGNVFSGGASTTGGTADPRNNVESVFLPAGTSGTFTARVIATNIAGDGVPGNGDSTDQDFALVIYNGGQGSVGYLTGAVTDSTTSTGLVGVTIQAASSPTQTSNTTSGPGGVYAFTLLTNTYTVTASTYGYLPASISGVSIVSGTTTTLNIALDPAPTHLVSGTVTDATTGWPLYANLTLGAPGFAGASRWNDPVTGFYSFTVAGGITHTVDAQAWAQGYLPKTVTVPPLTGNATVNVGLNPNLTTCTAPGYKIVGGFAENFDSLTPPALGSWATAIITDTATDPVWATRAGTRYPSGVAAHSTLNLVFFNSFSVTSGGAARLYRTSGIDMTAMPTTTLTFWMYHDTGYSTSNDRVQPQVSTNGGTTWQNVGAPVSRYRAAASWLQHPVDLSAYAAQTDLRLAFLGISAYGNDVHIDDIALGTPVCAPQAGGLVVGNVSDVNTSAPLAGAVVTNDSGRSATTMATVDPAVPDSFYTLFSPAGSHTFTATMSGGYGPSVLTPTVIQSSTIRQDFALPAGRLSFAPPTLEATLDWGASVTQPLTLSNTGGMSLSFEILETPGGFTPRVLVVRNSTAIADAMQAARRPVELSVSPIKIGHALAAPWKAAGPVSLILDDGSMEDSVGVNGGGVAYQFIWLNRFTPASADFPFQLEQISMIWPSGQVAAGDAIELVVYQDTDGDGAPSNATHLASYNVTVQTADGVKWNNYTLTPPVILNGPGDVLIGAIDRFVTSGVTAANYPAAYDSTASQGRSWVGWWNADPPTPPVLPPDSTFGTVDSLGLPGNFMIRGSGHTLSGSSAVPWLDESPISGTLSADTGLAPIVVTFNANAVAQPGQYWATLQVKSDDPLHANYNIPVTMTVSVPATWGKLQGTVTGLLRCDQPGAPSDSASILVQNSAGLTWTATSNISGTYGLWLNEGAYTVTISRSGYATSDPSVATITGQVTTTHDVDLRLLAPCVSVTPSELTSAQPSDVQMTRTLTLNNTGAGGATWDIAEAIAWLSALPVGGTVSGDGSSVVVATFDSTGLPTGVYTGSLTVNTSDSGQPSVMVPVTMTVQNPPSCGFTSSSPDDLGQATVFTNTTTGDAPMTYRWSFGDGSAISAATHPIHTYAHVGSYTVILTATNNVGEDVCTGPVSIEGVEASFLSNSPVALGTPAVFTNTTLANPPVTAWVWNLRDSSSSTAQTPPPHTYATVGVYTVTLTAISTKGSSTYTGTVTVFSSCAPVTSADYSFTPAAPRVGETVTFTGTSTGGTAPIAFTWTFGDGSVGNGLVVTHTFPMTVSAKTYTVTLSAANACTSPAITVNQSVTVEPFRIYLPILLR